MDKVLICDRSHTMHVNVSPFAQYAMGMLLMGVFQEHNGVTLTLSVVAFLRVCIVFNFLIIRAKLFSSYTDFKTCV